MFLYNRRNVTNVDTGATQQVPSTKPDKYVTWTTSFMFSLSFDSDPSSLHIPKFIITHWWWRRNGHEHRIVHRKALLEALAEELPMETVRYSSKLKSVVNQVEEGSSYAIIHMENGVSIKAKVNRNYIWPAQYYIAKTFFTKLARSD